MATEVVTPNVSGESSAPAAAPVSAPVTAPVTEAPASPAAPRDPVEVLREKAFSLDIPGVEKPKPAGEVKAEDVAKPVVEAPPAAPADAGKTDEQKAEEAKAAAEAANTVEENPLDKLGPLPAEKVGEALKDQAFVEALKAKGLDPDILMETSRMAAETQAYRDAGLPTPESAAFAVENANHFYDVEEGFTKVKDARSLDDYMYNVMLPLSFIRDADGNPIPDPTTPGAFKTDGSVNRFMQANVDFDHQMAVRVADHLLTEADKFKNADGEYATEQAAETAKYYSQIKDAIAFIDEFRKNNYKMPSGEAKPQMSPEDKAEMDRLRARDTQVTEQEKANRAEKTQIFATQVQTDTLAVIDPLVNETLATLDEYVRPTALANVWTDLTKALAENRTFQQQKAALYAKGMDEKNFKSLVALNTRTAKALLLGQNGILQKHLTAAGKTREARQQQRDQKIDTQTKKDTMNQGARAAASTNATASMTSAQVQAKARELATAENGGKPPEDAAVLRHVLKLRGIA
jgi:hypothetical protein